MTVEGELVPLGGPPACSDGFFDKMPLCSVDLEQE